MAFWGGDISLYKREPGEMPGFFVSLHVEVGIVAKVVEEGIADEVRGSGEIVLKASEPLPAKLSKVGLDDVLKYLPDGMALVVSEDELKRIESAVRRLTRGSAYTGILDCFGPEKCVYGKSCPFYGTEVDYPLLQKCPFERAMADAWMDDYVESLGIDTGDKAELVLVEKLVEIDIEEARARAKLAKEDFEQVVVTENENGKRFERKLHNAVAYIEKLEKRRMTILKALMATRDTKFKELKKTALDPSTYAAKLRKKAAELEKKFASVRRVDDG